MNWTNITLEDMVASSGNVSQAPVARATRPRNRLTETEYIDKNPTTDSHARNNASQTISGNNANRAVTSESSDILEPVSLAPDPPTEPPNVAPVGGINARPRPRNL